VCGCIPSMHVLLTAYFEKHGGRLVP
jgi:hypothetical protein